MKFGKLPKKSDYRTLRLKNYLTSDLAPPPATYSTLTSVYANLGITDPTQLFPMDGNDVYGDCTIAALAHAITIYSGLLSKKNIMASADCVALFESLGGVGTGGLVELDVLNYWKSNAVSGDQILGYVSIDPRNHSHVQSAIQLFGGVYLGFQVTTQTSGQFQAKQPWTPAPPTHEGHAVFAAAYDQNSIDRPDLGNHPSGDVGLVGRCC